MTSSTKIFVITSKFGPLTVMNSCKFLSWYQFPIW